MLLHGRLMELGSSASSSASHPKGTPKRALTKYAFLDLDLQTQGESFAGTTLLAPVEEGYKREELAYFGWSCANLQRARSV